MKRVALLLMLAACKHPPAPAPIDAAVEVDAGVDAALPPPADITALLSGGPGVNSLPEQATDPDHRFDYELRERLTTQELPSGGGLGSLVIGEVTIGAAKATVPVTDMDRVLAGIRARFRQCYRTGLNSDPSMSGKLTLTAHVDPNGEVAAANVAQNTGLSVQVASCVSRTLQRAQFNAPGGKGSDLTVPVTFATASE